MRRPTANSDQALTLILVDTGLRAPELCSLKISDFDPKRGKLEVRYGVPGGAGGGKGTTIFLGKTVRHYARIARLDREQAHRTASPEDNGITRAGQWGPGSRDGEEKRNALQNDHTILAWKLLDACLMNGLRLLYAGEPWPAAGRCSTTPVTKNASIYP
jgi:integrase